MQIQTAASVARALGASPSLGDDKKSTVQPSSSGVTLFTIVDGKRIDFRVVDVRNTLESLLTRLAPAQHAVAAQVFQLALATGVYPSRVTLSRDGELFFYFFPGGQAPSQLDRAHALITVYEDGGLVALLTNRATSLSEAWEPSTRDVNATLGRIRTFLRDGTAG